MLEGISFKGIIGYTLRPKGEPFEVLEVEGFSFGILGNVVICEREKFTEMATQIVQIKRELEKGNQLPYSKFVLKHFYTQTAN